MMGWDDWAGHQNLIFAAKKRSYCEQCQSQSDQTGRHFAIWTFLKLIKDGDVNFHIYL
jgi:hypothetical protein